MKKRRRRRNPSVQEWWGGNPPPQKVVKRAMVDLRKTLARRFQERKKQLARLAKANAPLRDKLLGVFGNDRSWAASSRDARRKARASLASHRISVSKALPQKVGASVFVGMNGGARFVPFDYSWKNSYGTGAPHGADLKADATAGEMQINANTYLWGGGFSAYAAVGIFFRLPSLGFSRFPGFRLANLTVSATPSVYFGWQAFLDPRTLAEAGGAGSSGNVGLWAQSYDSTAAWPSPYSGATLVEHDFLLWRYRSLGLGDGGWNGLSVPLSVSLLVDSDHWYVLWVLCATHGWGYVSWQDHESWVVSRLRVNVPSINLQFHPLLPDHRLGFNVPW